MININLIEIIILIYYDGGSEFCGHPLDIQTQRIKDGLKNAEYRFEHSDDPQFLAEG